MTNPAAHIFASLPGEWSLSRTIPDYGRIDGTVIFTPLSSNRLRYQEEGMLQSQNGHESTTSRSYIYELQEDKLVIYYDDPLRQGDILHELIFSAEEQGFVSQHCHQCAPDTYDLVFRINKDRSIAMDYKVSGPKKDYTMQSVLTRGASGPS